MATSPYDPQLEQYTTGDAAKQIGSDGLNGAQTGAQFGGPVGGLIGGVVGIGAGIVGAGAAADANAKALAAQQAALARLGAIQAPESTVNFNPYAVAGTYNPNLQQTFQQGNTELGNVNVDPSLMGAAHSELQQLQQIGNNGGLTIADQANLNHVLSQTGQANAGAQQAIMQNFAARGMGGSGFQLAQQLQAQQAAGNNANAQGTNIAAEAQQRALQAIMGAGNLGQSMNQQLYGQQANTANAQDLINRFNTANQQAVASQNTGTQNTAQQYNLGNAQQVANANVGLSNQQQLQNNAYQQQTFEDQLNQGKAYAGQSNNVAGQYANNGAQTAGAIGQVGQGIAQIGASLDKGGTGGQQQSSSASAPVDWSQYQMPDMKPKSALDGSDKTSAYNF